MKATMTIQEALREFPALREAYSEAKGIKDSRVTTDFQPLSLKFAELPAQEAFLVATMRGLVGRAQEDSTWRKEFPPDLTSSYLEVLREGAQGEEAFLEDLVTQGPPALAAEPGEEAPTFLFLYSTLQHLEGEEFLRELLEAASQEAPGGPLRKLLPSALGTEIVTELFYPQVAYLAAKNDPFQVLLVPALRRSPLSPQERLALFLEVAGPRTEGPSILTVLAYLEAYEDLREFPLSWAMELLKPVETPERTITKVS